MNNKQVTIVPDVRAEIKLFSGIFLKDVACIGICGGAALLLSELFPDTQSLQQTIFMVLGFVLGVYLDLRPRTNPGKRNFEVVWMLLTNRQPKLFKSFGYYEFSSRKKLREEFK